MYNSIIYDLINQLNEQWTRSNSVNDQKDFPVSIPMANNNQRTTNKTKPKTETKKQTHKNKN